MRRFSHWHHGARLRFRELYLSAFQSGWAQGATPRGCWGAHVLTCTCVRCVGLRLSGGVPRLQAQDANRRENPFGARRKTFARILRDLARGGLGLYAALFALASWGKVTLPTYLELYLPQR